MSDPDRPRAGEFEWITALSTARTRPQTARLAAPRVPNSQAPRPQSARVIFAGGGVAGENGPRQHGGAVTEPSAPKAHGAAATETSDHHAAISRPKPSAPRAGSSPAPRRAHHVEPGIPNASLVPGPAEHFKVPHAADLLRTPRPTPKWSRFEEMVRSGWTPVEQNLEDALHAEVHRLADS